MSRVALAPPDLLSVVTVGNPDDLERIHEPGVALVRWRRSIPEPQRAWLDAMPAAKLPTARFKARLGAVEAAVQAAFEARGDAAEPGRHMVVADIVLMAMLFSHVERTDWLAVRLEAIDNDACERPHVDMVRAWLLCTCRGEGTEFGRLTERGWRRDTALAPFEVGLVKGLLHPTIRDGGAPDLAHRSPRFAPGDSTRLLICIDRADAPSAATYH